MTTTSGPLDQAFDWVLDRDGDLYGDEQERLRWYEAIAVAASVQWILIPWLAVPCLALWGRPAAPAVVLLLLGLYLPMLIANGYVTRRRVRTAPEVWSRKRIAVTFAALLPYVILFVQFFLLFEVPDGATIGALVGGVLGVCVVAAAQRVQRRRRRARDLDPTDVE